MVVVYDIETLKECFTYTYLDIKTEEIKTYVINKLGQNDYADLINHLNKLKGQIGFNNVNFDYIIIHMLMSNYADLKFKSADYIIETIYDKAQEIIDEQNKEDFFKTIAIKSKYVKIPQCDLFKIWHYNNKQRSTSLKALQISMNYPNVEEMPIHHSKEGLTKEDIDNIIHYNKNDVLSTYEFYKRSREKIDLRLDLEQLFKIPCLNFSDSKIGEQLMLKLYCEETDDDIWDVKAKRTYRSKIQLKDCILDKIKFENKCFNDFLNELKSKTIYKTKGAFKKSVIYKGFKYDYGTGGIHGCIKSGIYKSDEDYIIIDADVASLYPFLALTNGFYIEHLGRPFLKIYQRIVDMRIEAKANKNLVLSDGLKLSANSVYGKSNDINSFLYDPKYTMQITLNGQLLLTMLAEQLTKIPNMTILQINTDGITCKIPNNQRSINMYYNICNRWQEFSKLTLEYAEYSKMIIADVNNYIAVKHDGKIKHKGRFEVDKMVGSERAYHKDNSFRIVPLALEKYFVNNIPIEETIKNHKNIYDFCGRQKFNRESYGTLNYINKDLKRVCDKTNKNLRYYISNKGSVFIKHYNKGTIELINKGFLVTPFNRYIEKEDYDINYTFYIKECKKEINLIENKQLELF
jgi:hypothetical protein